MRVRANACMCVYVDMQLYKVPDEHVSVRGEIESKHVAMPPAVEGDRISKQLRHTHISLGPSPTSSSPP